MDPAPLNMFAEAFDGSVREATSRSDRPIFRCEITGNRAVRALQAMLPYMVVKKNQAVLVLAARAMEPSTARDDVLAECKRLKHVHHQNNN